MTWKETLQQFDSIVVGAGAVGLAVARRLTQAGLSTLVLDGETTFGTWTSSRNSEVIHAGIYYEEGSLKQSLCTAGREMLYRYCHDCNVPHRRIGKLIFAASASEAAALDVIAARASAAGVMDLVRLTSREVRQTEPELRCHEALLSPSTGILDSHSYMLALIADLEAGSGMFVSRSTVSRLSRRNGNWQIHLAGEEQPVVQAANVVNAAGLAAHRLARATDDLPEVAIPEVRYARGVYFDYGKVPFDHLIYPVPVPGGLGTHLTLDMAGRGRFGPDVEWIDGVDYRVDPARHGTFVRAAKLIWPGLDPSRLVPGYAGIRPKLSGPDEPAADFHIAGPEMHGLDGLVNLLGIESPGLTASLAIADLVAAKLGFGEIRPDAQQAMV
jgi:L-2-hydroxyglutarate oxidase LhgO